MVMNCSTQSGVLGPKTWSFGGTVGMCYCWAVSAISVGCCFKESHSGRELLNLGRYPWPRFRHGKGSVV